LFHRAAIFRPESKWIAAMLASALSAIGFKARRKVIGVPRAAQGAPSKKIEE
jgi:hypothetical protein